MALNIPEEIREEFEVLTSNTVEVLPAQEFANKLYKARKENRPLRIKYGADPSAPDLHLGHSVPIRKLRQFQDYGHTVVFLIGGYTARIGDPSGKNSARPRLTKGEVQANAQTYLDQIFQILDRRLTEVVDNSDWLESMDVSSTIELMSKYTVSQMLERDDFTKRFNNETPIYIHEFIYPLLQGYDSIAIKADVELGGTDQKFNLLVGRELQRIEGMEPQCIMTTPLLVGLDGSNKMSKSLGNYIGVSESARDMFGKAMSIPDELMTTYYDLLLSKGPADSQRFKGEIESGNLHPRDAKMKIAGGIVDEYHGEGKGDEEQAEFLRRFSTREFPEDTAEKLEFTQGEVPSLQQLLTVLGSAKSSREAQRLVSQNSIKVTEAPEGFSVENGAENTLAVLKQELPKGVYKLKIGKTRFVVISIT